MPSESDLHLLEAYLDDGLSTSEVLRLDTRLSANPALATTLKTLRTERALRIAAFQSVAPSQADGDRMADMVLAGIRRQNHRGSLQKYLRITAGVAACMLVGFAVGWLGRGGVTMLPASHGPSVSVATPVHAHPDARLVVQPAKLSETGQYRVAILDENGNVIALQPFTKLEDARQFANDLGQYEVRHKQVQESQAMLVSDRF